MQEQKFRGRPGDDNLQYLIQSCHGQAKNTNSIPTAGKNDQGESETCIQYIRGDRDDSKTNKRIGDRK